MDYVSCFEIAAGGYHGASHTGASYFVALELYFGTAFFTDCPGDTAAQNQSSVGGVDNSIRFHLGYIAFEKFQDAIFDVYFHRTNFLIFRLIVYHFQIAMKEKYPLELKKNKLLNCMSACA
jgi:hypothetical protein